MNKETLSHEDPILQYHLTEKIPWGGYISSIQGCALLSSAKPFFCLFVAFATRISNERTTLAPQDRIII